MVEPRTPEREVRGLRPTSAGCVHRQDTFTPRNYWLNTQEAMALSQNDLRIVDGDVKHQYKLKTLLPDLTLLKNIIHENMLILWHFENK